MKDSREQVSLGPLEEGVMGVIWPRGKATVREVHEELAARGSTLAYTTIMTVMTRLAAKGLLTRRRLGRSFQYKVRVKEDRFREQAAQALARRLVTSFGRLAIASFVDEVAKVGPERLKELEQLARRTSRRA